MFAIYNDEDEVVEIFEDQENAEKCLCIEYENGSSYEVREFDPEEDAVYDVDDEKYSNIPYEFFAVEIESEICAAFLDKGDADAYADNYLERAILAVAEELGYDEDDIYSKRGDLAFQAGYEYGAAEVLRITPLDDEKYRDCLYVWKRDEEDDYEFEEDED